MTMATAAPATEPRLLKAEELMNCRTMRMPNSSTECWS
jgi:hypothetical protein